MDSPAAKRLLAEAELAASETVANNAMNRERRLRGTNSYAKDLGFDPAAFLAVKSGTAWLDLCCGTGRALIQAARELPEARILGVDLVPHFDPLPSDLNNLRLETADLRVWRPEERFDLITCVHGLHYVGDKLGLLARIAGWLTPEGRFGAHLDLANVRVEGGLPGEVSRWLKGHGFTYEARRRLAQRCGPGKVTLPFQFLGADDLSGPNYTGQPAVTSYYRRRRQRRPRV
jgi:SAM-dependent methyltransferase